MHDFSIRSHFRRIQSLKKSGIPNNELILKGGTAECAERSAAPPQVGSRVLNFKSKSWPNIFKPQVAQLQKPRPRSPDYPLSISPPGSAHSAGPAQNRNLFCFCRLFFDFLAFRNALQKRLRKNIEKSAKIKEFGLPKPFQNPSKTPLKTMFQQTCDFSAIFMRKRLCRKSADIDFVLVFPILFACRTLFFKSLLAWILGPENLPKTSPKPPPSRPKIDAKNVLFLNIDFFRFRPRFWRVLGLQLGAKFILKAVIWQ